MKRVLAYLAVILAGTVANSAYLDSEYAPGAEQRIPRPVSPLQPYPGPPHPVPLDDVSQFLDNLRLGRPYEYRGLTLFPVELFDAEDATHYATLREALNRGWLGLRDSGCVGEVVASNHGPRYVFLMAGELLFGGRQNRMLRADVLLWPDSGTVAVPVYCVRTGRWQGMDFDATGGLSAFGLCRQAQDAVWHDVRNLVQRFSVDSPTEDYGAVLESGGIERRLSGFRGAFRRCFPRRTVGLIAAEGADILGADFFCNRRLFTVLRDETIDSYAVEVIQSGKQSVPGRLNENAVRLFLGRIRRSRFHRAAAPGAGRSLVFHGPGVQGRALIFRRAVIHLEATDID